MGLLTTAQIEQTWILAPLLGLLLGVVSFFVTRFFQKTDKVEESTVTHVTHIALIHEKIGQHASSEQKQWATIDTLSREISEMKLKIAVLEDRRRGE
jgi:hypothetical protein